MLILKTLNGIEIIHDNTPHYDHKINSKSNVRVFFLSLSRNLFERIFSNVSARDTISSGKKISRNSSVPRFVDIETLAKINRRIVWEEKEKRRWGAAQKYLARTVRFVKGAYVINHVVSLCISGPVTRLCSPFACIPSQIHNRRRRKTRFYDRSFFFFSLFFSSGKRKLFMYENALSYGLMEITPEAQSWTQYIANAAGWLPESRRKTSLARRWRKVSGNFILVQKSFVFFSPPREERRETEKNRAEW